MANISMDGFRLIKINDDEPAKVPQESRDVIDLRIDILKGIMKEMEWIPSYQSIKDEQGNEIDRIHIADVAAVSRMVSPKFIRFDKSYQRIDSVSEKEYLKLVDKFDPALLGALICVYHPEDGTLSCVDGYHRYMAAAIIDMDRLPVIIIKYLGDDVEERRKYEANLFISQNNATKKVSPSQKHKGKVLTGDETALIVEELCKRDDVAIEWGRGKKPSKTIGNYNKVADAAKKGKECLEYVFDILKISGFDIQPNGYAGYLIEALTKFYSGYGQTVKAETIGNYLRGKAIETFRADAVHRYPEHNHNYGMLAMVMFLQDYVMENANLSAAFDSNGRKIVSILA